MSLRDDLLPIFDVTRALLADLQVGPNRLTDVALRTITWSGGAPGLGTEVVTLTPLTLDAAGHRVKVTSINSHDIIASGGRYQDGDYRIGPFTPPYAGGGRDVTYFEPPSDGTSREVHVILNGPGLTNAVGRVIDTQTDKTFRYTFTVRLTNSTIG